MKKVVACLLSVILLLTLFGCANTNRGFNRGADALNEKNIGDFPDDGTGISAYNGFSYSFFKNAVSMDPNKNVCISPFSAYMAFSLCFSGANGQTLQQFENVFGMKKAEAMDFCRTNYVRFLRREYSDENTKVNLANSIWIDNEFGDFVKKEFIDGATDYFNAPVYKRDFKLASTVDEINDWCSDNTDGLIKDIIDSLDEDMIMALINALLVEVNWSNAYDYTVNADFTEYNGTKKQATYLPRKIGVYYHDATAKAFKMPLRDGFSFVGILPEESVGIDRYVSELSAAKISNLLSSFDSSCDVYTRIPKFNTDYEVDLTKLMKTMGITTAFDPNFADLRSMVEIPDVNAYIGAAKQKTHFELDENGIKAAAVTYIGVDATGVPAPKPSINLYLDRPFVYMLVDNTTNLPLFIGTLKNV